MKIVVAEHPDNEAAKALTETLRANADKPILLLVSGGSAFGLFEGVDPSVLGPHLTLTVLDERYSTDPTINNFAQLEATSFYTKSLERSVHLIDTKVLAGESLFGFSERFESSLRAWKAQHTNGVVVATMGIGVDGHTAGIFPGEWGVDFSGEAWVVGYSVPLIINPYPDRVTVTYTFLRSQLNAVIVYATGNDKVHLIQELRTMNTFSPAAPFSIFKELPELTIFTNSSD